MRRSYHRGVDAPGVDGALVELVEAVVDAVAAGRDHEPLVVAAEVSEHVVGEHRLVADQRRQVGDLGGVRLDGSLLRGLRRARQRERAEMQGTRFVALGPVPEPDRELPQLGVGTARGSGGAPSEGGVVGMPVLGPRRDEQGAAAVADDLDEAGGERVDVVAQATVGEPEAMHLRRQQGGAEDVHGGLPLGSATLGHRLGGVGRGVGMAPFPVGGADEDDGDLGVAGGRHQSAGSQRLVVGVGTHHDHAVRAQNAGRRALTGLQVGSPHLGRRARTVGGERRSRRHQVHPLSWSRTIEPCRARSRSAWCCRR